MEEKIEKLTKKIILDFQENYFNGGKTTENFEEEKSFLIKKFLIKKDSITFSFILKAIKNKNKRSWDCFNPTGGYNIVSDLSHKWKFLNLDYNDATLEDQTEETIDFLIRIFNL